MAKWIYSFFGIFIISLVASCVSTATQTNYSEIEYEATPCFGTCSVFTITVQNDKSAVFKADNFNFTKDISSAQEKEGMFSTRIKEEDFNRLISLLERAEPEKLDEFYGNRNVTDLPTSHLRIKKSSGERIAIEDYGSNGPESLQAIYNFFEELRFNQDWKKMD